VSLAAPNGSAGVPASVTIPAGATSMTFPIGGVRIGVEELSATPNDGRYDTAYARVQVAAPSALRFVAVSGDAQQIGSDGSLGRPVVVRLTDVNNLPYPGVRVLASASGNGSVTPASAVTDHDGRVTFGWTAGKQSSAQLRVIADGAPDIAPLVASALAPTVQAAAVLNAATLQQAAAPGMLATVYGANLDAPGTQVTLDGRSVPVVSVENGRIQFYIPPDAPLGISTVVISNALGSSDPIVVAIAAVAPGIFYDASSGFASGLERPSPRGTVVEIYCTGLGPHPENVVVTIGGIEAEVTYSGPAPGMLGVNQVNARIPENVPPGTRPMMLTIHEIRSNQVRIGVE
jgi:uncharacterized protein (TIGR03437 family)